jgi:hypothetical protein
VRHHRQLAQVEQGVSGSEGNTVIATDAGRQAALLKEPPKHGESVAFLGGREGFTGGALLPPETQFGPRRAWIYRPSVLGDQPRRSSEGLS